MTIKEIAQLAGVSISTVSKIIHNKDQGITVETRNKVLDIVKKYNYSPYSDSISRSDSKSFILAVLLKGSPTKKRMVSGVLHAAGEKGYDLLVYDSMDDYDRELRHITSICKNNVDAVIWEPVGELSKNQEHYLTDKNISVISTLPILDALSYQIDYQSMGYDLTKCLINSRHTCIAFLLSGDHLHTPEVIKGYKKCLFDHQLAFQEDLVIQKDDPLLMAKLNAKNVSSVICDSHESAYFFHSFITKMHYNIPYDFSAVSVLDSDEKNAKLFPVSGILVPYYEYGKFLCHHLVELCEHSTLNPAESFAVDNIFNHNDSIYLPKSLRNNKMIVVGSINIDTTFCVDFMPQSGQTIRAYDVTSTTGGKGMNQAVSIARLEKDSFVIAKIGNDAESVAILEDLDHEHVSALGVSRASNLPTGRAYIYTDNTGESSITIVVGANKALSPRQVTDCSYLFQNATYCLISTEISIPTALEAIQVAKQNHTKIVVKPSAQHTIPDEIMNDIDLFIPNQKEATVLCPHCNHVEDQANYFYEKGAKIVIITLGNEGCYLRTHSYSRYFSAVKVKAVDTTGGADAFISSLVVYLSDGYDLDTSIKIASYAAAICVSKLGAISSFPDRSTLEEYIKQHEPTLLR